MNRRSFLAGASLLVFSGCVSTGNRNTPMNTGDSNTQITIVEATPPENSYGEAFERGEGPRIEAAEDVNGDDVKYIPETNEVSYVAGWSHSEGEVWETVSFETWGKIETARIASKAVRQYVSEKADLDNWDDLMVGRTSRTGKHVVLVRRTTDEEMTFDELLSITPAQVSSTMRLSGESYSAEVPVFVDHRFQEMERI